MIEVKDKKDSCGCHACATACAKHCIAMETDAEGLCEKVCPVINQDAPKGEVSLFSIDMEVHGASYDALCANNPALIVACRVPADRKKYFTIDVCDIYACINKLCGDSLILELEVKIRRILHKKLNLLRST